MNLKSRGSEAGEDGRVLVPAEFREQLGMTPGTKLVVELVDDELRIHTRAACIERARRILAPYLRGPNPVDELIAERRTEAAREAAEHPL